MGKIKRRKFLKYSAAGVSAAMLSHYLSPALVARQTEDRPWVDRCTGKKVEGTPSTCTGCNAGCGIVAYVRSGQLLKISGNPAHPVNKGALCLVGQAGLYSVYDPERVLKPLVRSGKRGQVRWKEITWDEAAAIIAQKMKSNARRGLVLETRGGSSTKASREFASRFGGALVSHDYIVSPNREAALKEMFGVRYDYPDVANTNYILNFGSNPFESDPFGIGTAGPMAKLRAKGGAAKIVTFDPRLSATAGRSDEWLPLMAGTDSVVALAMANVIMSEGAYDRGFIERNTNITIARLKAHLSAYTPASAERISGISADDIKRVALEYAAADRAVLLTGGGVSKHPDGTDSERAVRLLSVITGKINRPGCNIIPKGAGIGGSGTEAGAKTPEAFYKKLLDGRQKVGVYIVHGSDPAYGSPESGKMKKLLADEDAVPYIVAMDTHVNDTGMMADMVLPMATYLEEYGVEASPGPGGEQVIGYRQPVVPPAGDSKPYVEILSAIAGKAGSRMSYSDSEDYAGKLIAPAGGLKADELEKKGFVSPARQLPAGKEGAHALKTPSRRVTVSLPSFAQLHEYSNMKAEEFIMVTYAPSAYREGFTENNMLLREIFHNNPVFVNSASGRAIGLKNLERVTVNTPLGKMEGTVMLSPGIQPKTVAVARGCGHEGYGNIEKGQRFTSQDPFTVALWWDKDGGTGVNPNRITPFNIDENSGGQGWMLTRVTLAKA